MKINFSTWSTSDYAAWWGAIVATIAAIWNIVKAYRSGARVHVKATPEMTIYPPQRITKDNSYISVTAINRGNAPTTITHFCGYYTKNFWDRLLKKKQQFIVPTNSALGQSIPFILKPGEEWSNMAEQEGLKETCNGSLLYIGVMHNQRKRPVYKRVKFKV